MVTVTTATATVTAPTVFPLMQCGSGTGGTVTLGCLATGFAPSALTYGWSEKGVGLPLTDFIQYPPIQKNNLYQGVSQIQVSRADWDAKKEFTCTVTHQAGTAQSDFKKPEVEYRDPTLKVLASISSGDSETYLSCWASDFSPAEYEIKWLTINNQEITTKIHEMKTLPLERKDENGTLLYSVAHILTMNSSDPTLNIPVTCLFEGKGEKGPSNKNKTITITKCYDDPPPTQSCGSTGCPEADADVNILNPSMEDMLLHHKGTVTCSVKINKPSLDKISWQSETGNPILDAIPTTNLKGRTGVFNADLTITYEEWVKGTKFVCNVEHEEWMEPVKTPYQRVNGGTTQRPSVFMLPPLEHTKKETVTLTCLVKDFYPKYVFVAWLVDDQETGLQYNTTSPIENQGSYSAYGQLTLSLEQWNDNDTVFSCVVYHESMVKTGTKAIVRSIGHRTFERTNLVNLNMNIPDTCNPRN
ncbi:hypothetical protein OYC64_006295 [Pagothenia borchgrevinki]|uniref:Ig-like domain-containing protein n=1 Tax=Pagothenia borchgrevinki TaxID=8213 RepID=A0ABD2GJ25_PAGBO